MRPADLFHLIHFLHTYNGTFIPQDVLKHKHFWNRKFLSSPPQPPKKANQKRSLHASFGPPRPLWHCRRNIPSVLTLYSYGICSCTFEAVRSQNEKLGVDACPRHRLEIWYWNPMWIIVRPVFHNILRTFIRDSANYFPQTPGDCHVIDHLQSAVPALGF